MSPGSGVRDTALRHSQLARCSFQYTSSTPPGFTTEIHTTKFQYAISARLKLKPNEQDKSQTVVFQLSLSFSSLVGAERAERTLPTRCVPRSSPIRPSACPSFRPRPATARPRALRLATLLRGAGLERWWWCHTGEGHWKAVQGGSEDVDVRSRLRPDALPYRRFVFRHIVDFMHAFATPSNARASACVDEMPR
jgi:hypothetical protein